MKQPRIKGQALALVLIVIVVAVIVAFSITSRVVQDIQQQGEERASTRAETISESAVENITLKLQSGVLVAPAGNSSPVTTFAVGMTAPEGQTGIEALKLCDSESTDPETQCDNNSLVQVGFYKMIVQFKLFDSENMEVFMNKPLTANVVPSPFPPAVPAAKSEIVIHLKTDGNTSFSTAGSKILVKGFTRSASGLQVLGECLMNLDESTTGAYTPCLPSSMQILNLGNNCETVKIQTNLATATFKNEKIGDLCFKVRSTGTYGISSYRIKPLLKSTSTVKTDVPYVDVSVTASTAANADQQLPEYQMAMITAGVYSGTTANDQQVFQQTTRLVLLNKSVPEVADYVLYNGSSSPIVKQK